MGYVIGSTIALGVALFARLLGFDRERSFYAVVLIVVAHYYVLFATTVGALDALAVELIPTLVFVAAAAVGFKQSLWVVAAGLAGHGVFDFFHHGLIDNPGVPAWWPAFCLSFDVVAAACLAVLIRARKVPHASA